MSDRLCQDEPGKGARGLTRWFASRLGARRWLKSMFVMAAGAMQGGTR